MGAAAIYLHCLNLHPSLCEKTSNSRLNSIYGAREGRHPSESSSYLTDKTLDTSTVQLLLSQGSFHRLGIRLYLMRTVYLIRMNGQQLNKLLDLVQCFCVP